MLDRAGDGTLTQKPGTAGCIQDASTLEDPCLEGTAVRRPQSVTVSPDGSSVYVTSISHAVAIFDRAPNGRLFQKPDPFGCISEDAAGLPCIDGTALDRPVSVTVSPDGLSVYVASDFDDAVAVFDRAPNGTLAQKPGTAGCIREAASGRRCVAGAALLSTSWVAVSPDGLSVYVTSEGSDAVAVFDREPNHRRRSRRRGSLADSSLPPALRSGPSR